MVLLVVADANYNFIYIDVGSFGREGDSTIYENSTFRKSLMSNSLNIPNSEPLPNTTRPKMPYVFVGDDAFGLSQHIMRPFRRKLLTKIKKVFNYQLSCARRYVECVFGIFSNKCRIFHRALDVNINFAISIIKTCCLLYNFFRKRDGCKYVDTLSVVGLSEENDSERNTTEPSNSRPHVTAIRNQFANYFLSDVGRVPWQDNYID